MLVSYLACYADLVVGDCCGRITEEQTHFKMFDRGWQRRNLEIVLTCRGCGCQIKLIDDDTTPQRDLLPARQQGDKTPRTPQRTSVNGPAERRGSFN